MDEIMRLVDEAFDRMYAIRPLVRTDGPATDAIGVVEHALIDLREQIIGHTNHIKNL